VEGRAKKTPERVKRRRLQRGSSEEDSREGQEKKTPVDDRVKKTPGRAK
jgi:hypothetical protein